MLKGVRIAFAESLHAKEISCETCHLSVEGAVQKELAWTNLETGSTEPVAVPTELCIKCHPDQEAAKPASEAMPAAHPEYGCLDCHNAHKPQVSCTQSACHTDIRDVRSAVVEKPPAHPSEGDPNNYMCGGTACHDLAKLAQAAPIYHQPIHSQVPCFVCHDSSGMTVAKDKDQGWVTVMAGAGGAGIPGAVVSHRIRPEVVCQKCHSYNNPWNLQEILPLN